MDLLISQGQIGPKSMNFIRKLNRGNFYFSNHTFQIWWLISSIKVMKKYKNSVLYL